MSVKTDYDQTIPADNPLAEMLYHSCGLRDAWELADADGFQLYHFEGHCFAFDIEARKLGREWQIRGMVISDC